MVIGLYLCDSFSLEWVLPEPLLKHVCPLLPVLSSRCFLTPSVAAELQTVAPGCSLAPCLLALFLWSVYWLLVMMKSGGPFCKRDGDSAGERCLACQHLKAGCDLNRPALGMGRAGWGGWGWLSFDFICIHVTDPETDCRCSD